MADKNSKPINQVDIEKILKENNAFLKKVGGQIEQNEFKRDVKRALEILSNNYEKKSDDKNYNVLDDYDAVVRLMREVDVSEDSDCFKSLISNFMPEEYEKAVEEKKNSQKKEKEVAEEVEKDEINEVTEQVESEDKIESEAEVEQGEPEVEEQESEKTTTQDDEKEEVEEVVEEEIEQEEAETELDQEGIEQEESEPEVEETEQEIEDQEETEQESEEQENFDQDNDKDDENERGNSIGKAMRNIATTAKKVSQIRRKNGNFDKSITEEIEDVVKKAQKTLINGKILGMNGGYLHDFTVTLAIIAKSVGEIALFSAGKATLKLAKGVKQFIGKKFTAAKGTAQKAKEKADAERAKVAKRKAEITEQNEKNKKEKVDEPLNVIGASATSVYEFMELTENRAKESREVCNETCKKDFLDNLENSADFREKAEKKLEVKNSYDIQNEDTLLYDIKEQYKKIIYDNMYREIKNNFKGLSDEKIMQFINDSGIKKGQLSLSANGYITAEQLKDSELYETLEKTNKIEKYLNNLSEEDIDSLLELSHRLNSKIETPKEGPASNKGILVFGLNEISNVKSNEELDIDINEGTFEFAKMFTELNIPYETADKEIENINNSVKRVDANADVLKYCYSLDLQSLSTELWFQMVAMRTELSTMKYKDGKSISDELRKKELMSIATSKVKALEKKGIIETIQGANEKEIKILSEAEDVLENVESIVDMKKSRIYRETKNNEDNEQTQEEQEDEQEP